jgi:hypothetical protein
VHQLHLFALRCANCLLSTQIQNIVAIKGQQPTLHPNLRPNVSVTRTAQLDTDDTSSMFKLWSKQVRPCEA